MQDWLEPVLILLLLLNLQILVAGRLLSAIRAVAVQGAVLGAATLLVRLHAGLSAHLFFLVFGTIAIKGVWIPALLRRTLRDTQIRQDVEPAIGPAGSMVCGTLLVALSLALARHLELPGGKGGSDLLVPVALSTVLSGFFALFTRAKPLPQLIGYLLFENGIFLFGLAVPAEMPFLIEVGVLLDLILGVFVMGIVHFRIVRTLDLEGPLLIRPARDRVPLGTAGSGSNAEGVI